MLALMGLAEMTSTGSFRRPVLVVKSDSQVCKYTIYNNHTICVYNCRLSELLTSLALVGASLGIATVLGTLLCYEVKFLLRNQNQYRRS